MRLVRTDERDAPRRPPLLVERAHDAIRTPRTDQGGDHVEEAAHRVDRTAVGGPRRRLGNAEERPEVEARRIDQKERSLTMHPLTVVGSRARGVTAGQRSTDGSAGCDTPLVDIDQFWRIVDQARSDAGEAAGGFDQEAVADALTDALASLPREEILDFGERFMDVTARLESWGMCAACCLISGYVSDDHFIDFKAGVIALGHEAFERAADDPDSLADNPVVIDIAGRRLSRDALQAGDVEFAAQDAYTRLSDGDDHAYYEAQDALTDVVGPYQAPPRDWDGRFDGQADRDLIPVRLPRLASMFPLPRPQTRPWARSARRWRKPNER